MFTNWDALAMLKRVADGYGRNFLLPQGMAVLATAGAMKTAERIRQKATERRSVLNDEMSVVAEALKKIQISFGARAGETGKLYGSITSQEVVDAIQKKSGYVVKRQQLDMQPLRTLGEHTVRIRLTMDLIPEIRVTVFREGEAETQPADRRAGGQAGRAEAGRVCTRRSLCTCRGLISRSEPIAYITGPTLLGKPVMSL